MIKSIERAIEVLVTREDDQRKGIGLEKEVEAKSKRNGLCQEDSFEVRQMWRDFYATTFMASIESRHLTGLQSRSKKRKPGKSTNCRSEKRDREK